ncbi:hypothetical protein N2152v2_010634 [Parachlorella kessleri]
MGPGGATVDFSLQRPHSIETRQTGQRMGPHLPELRLKDDLVNKFKVGLLYVETLHVKLTYPKYDPNKPQGKQQYPVLVFLSGCGAQMKWYSHILDKVASWGYVVCQYQGGMVKILQQLLDWLQGVNSTLLYRMLDFNRLVLGGHSRGGAVAALIFADKVLREKVKAQALYLIDPVQKYMTDDAAAKLKASGQVVGITAAGHTTGWNPDGFNYKEFWKSPADGSWLEVVAGAYHTDFCDARNKDLNGIIAGLDRVSRFGDIATQFIQEKGHFLLAGKCSDDDVAESLGHDQEAIAKVENFKQDFLSAVDGKHLTPAQMVKDARREEFGALAATPMLAWFYKQLNPNANLQPFYDWVKAQEMARKITFEEWHSGHAPAPALQQAGGGRPGAGKHASPKPAPAGA